MKVTKMKEDYLMNNKKFLCSWSGGKDSCFAFIKSKQLGYEPAVLLNVLNEEGEISRSHGIPKDILQAQAAAINLPIHLVSSSWEQYEEKFTNALRELKHSYDVEFAVFGDIDLQAHRDWEAKVCMHAGLQAVLPIWQQNRKQLVVEMLDCGIETMIVSCNEQMGEEYLGKVLTIELINELEQMGIDACGENGEFHTLVMKAPIFSYPLLAEVKNKLKHGNYWFTQLALVEK